MSGVRTSARERLISTKVGDFDLFASREVNSSVVKALKILGLLGRSDEPLPLSQIAETLGYSESTVHRLLASLMAENYVRQSIHDARYHLGWQIVALAQSLGVTGQLPKILRPYLQAVLRQVKQSVNLGALNGSVVIYLDSVSPPDRISMRTPPGTSAPAYATAIGKALLACLPESEREALFASLSFQSLTPRTLTDAATLRVELDRIRGRGYALDHEEYYEGVQCIAAPIRDALGRGIAAVSITARSVDLPPDWEEAYSALLLGVCKQIEHQLNGPSR